MEEVLVDVCEHSCACLEVVESPLEPFWIRSTLRGSDSRMCDGDLKKDRRLLVGYGCLSDQLVRERVVPWKVDPNFRESELQKLELTKIFVQQIARYPKEPLSYRDP